MSVASKVFDELNEELSLGLDLSVDDGIHQLTEEGHIYGVHCGDANCYSCGTMKGECSWLDALDKLEDRKND